MIRPRLIPFLIISEEDLIKTKGFKFDRYLGDPINALRTFNEMEVDELVICDITGTGGIKPRINFELIEKLARFARMPLGYCGSIESLSDAVRVIDLGVEKIGIGVNGSAKQFELLRTLGSVIGGQSVTAIINFKRTFISKKVRLYDARERKLVSRVALEETIEILDSLGIGELVLSDVDRDGTRIGYDHRLLCKLRSLYSGPVTAVGGAKNLEDCSNLGRLLGVGSGLGAGSLFVYRGRKDAVLMNYPAFEEKRSILGG